MPAGLQSLACPGRGLGSVCLLWAYLFCQTFFLSLQGDPSPTGLDFDLSKENGRQQCSNCQPLESQAAMETTRTCRSPKYYVCLILIIQMSSRLEFFLSNAQFYKKTKKNYVLSICGITNICISTSIKLNIYINVMVEPSSHWMVFKLVLKTRLLVFKNNES